MSLQFAGLKPRTVHSYKRAIQRFFQYLDDEGIDIPASHRMLDVRVSDYLEHMWLDDEPMTYAGHLLSGLRRFMPHLRWRLPRARQYFSNWQASHQSKQAVPFPPVVIMAYAGLAVATKQYSLACLLLVGFLAFLRTGEIVSLTATKVAVDARKGRVLVALPSTKTSHHREETVCVDDVRVAKLTRFVLATTRGRLWTGSTSAFRATLNEFASFFDLSEFTFSAYSIRRGGASHAFASGARFDDLLVRGRWQSHKTARLYLDTGRAALIQLRFSSAQTSQLAYYTSKLEIFCEQLR